MQIPTKWYIYVLPGTVVLASLLFLTNLDGVELYLTCIQSNVLGSTILLGFATYLTGFVFNSILVELVRRIIDKVHHIESLKSFDTNFGVYLFQIGRADVIKEYQESYQDMVYLRLLFFSFCFSMFFQGIGLIMFCKEECVLRSIVLVCFSISTIALGMRWYRHRKDHDNFVKGCISLFKKT